MTLANSMLSLKNDTFFIISSICMLLPYSKMCIPFDISFLRGNRTIMQPAKIRVIVFILLVLCAICVYASNLDDASTHEYVRTRRQIAPLPSYFLLYSFQDNVTTILRYNLDGTGFYLVREQTINVPPPPSSQFLSVDFSLATSRLYFSLGTRIGVASLHEPEQTSSSLSIINPGQLDAVGPLTFDWVRDRIYFIGLDNAAQGIYSYDISSGLTTILSSFSNPSTSSKLCTAANDSLLFWNEGNTIRFGSPEIGNFEIFEEIDASQFGNILDLFCDSSSKLLSVYLSGRSIKQYDYTAIPVRTPNEIDTLVEGDLQLIQFPDNALCFSVFNNRLSFLMSSNEFTFILHSIRNSNDIVNYPVSFALNSFALVQPLLQPGVFTLPCGSEPCCTNNGGCSQVCVQFSFDSYYCTCRPGYSPTSFTGCALSSSTVRLVFSYYEQLNSNIELGVVRSRNLDGESSEVSLVNAQYMGQQTGKIEQLAISISNNELYILEDQTSNNILSRISLSDSANKQTIINLGSMTVGTLRYDWVSNYLYWTTGSSILRMRPSDSTFETFLTQNNTFALALHPLEQLICYSLTFATSADIICVNSSKTQLFSLSVGYPIFSLAVDLQEDRIYWGGRQQGFFQSCSIYNTTDCSFVSYPVLPDAISNNNFTFFIHIIGSRIVWLPVNSKSILQMNKLTGGDVVPFTITPGPNTAMISVNALDLRVSFYQPGLGYLSCLRSNGGCSHFCIPSSNGDSFSCGCVNGYMLRDNVTCEFIPPQTIPPTTITATAVPCETSFCLNDGTCMTSISLGPTCSCPSPYVGVRCQTFDVTQLLAVEGTQQETSSIIGGVVGAVVLLVLLAVVATIVLLFILRIYPISRKVEDEIKVENNRKEGTEEGPYVNASFEFTKVAPYS